MKRFQTTNISVLGIKLISFTTPKQIVKEKNNVLLY